MENCYFLNQRNYSISGELKGVRCNNQATVEEAKNGRIYHFCAVHSYTADRFVGAGDWAMNKRIEVTEYQCSPTISNLEEFIKAQCFDADGNHIMPEDGGMRGYEIDLLMNLAIGESMPLGDPEAGLTVVRLTDNGNCDHKTFGEASTIEQCIDKKASSWRRHCTVCGGGFANHMSPGHRRQHDKTDACNKV